MKLDAYGIYVHVPWCRVRCPYCAFYVVRDTPDAPKAAFVERTIAEARGWAPTFPGPAVSLFFGGGTPSRLSPDGIARLIEALPLKPGAEIGLEANPEDLEPAWIDAVLGAGVSRISVGVQTLQPAHARRLGRAHTVSQAEAALKRVASAGFDSWSADLMFALPGQREEDFARDLERLLALDPPHVSLYGLTFEPDTPFERLRQRGTLRPAPDETWRRMYDRAVDQLEAAGIARYEVSNFARPGHRSIHNSGYWEGRPYLGLGPSAHGLTPDGRRWVNGPDLGAWLGGAPPAIEHLSPEEQAADLLLAGIRRVEGVSLQALVARTGMAPDPKALAHLVQLGLLQRQDDHIALTPSSFPVADHAALRLVAALQPAVPQNL